MKAYFDAIAARIASQNPQWLWSYRAAPYVVVSFHDRETGRALCDIQDHVDCDVRVKAVAGSTPAGAHIVLDAVKAELSPGGASTPLTVPGHSAVLKWLRHEVTEVDESVTLTDSNRHPVFGVDTYRLISQPTT